MSNCASASLAVSTVDERCFCAFELGRICLRGLEALVEINLLSSEIGVGTLKFGELFKECSLLLFMGSPGLSDSGLGIVAFLCETRVLLG